MFCLDSCQIASGKTKEDGIMKRLLALFATTMALVFSTTARADLLNGLVGYWPFDGDAKDYSGNGNHGTTHGVSLTNDRHGNSGGAYYFGGYYDNGFKNEGYISVPNSSSLHAIGHSFTFASWVRIDAWCLANGDGGTYHDYWVSILCKGYANRQYGLQFQSYDNVENCWVGADSVFPAVVPGLKSWHHVAVTDDGTQLVEYVDGIFVSSGNIGGVISRNSESLYIGKDKPGDLEYFNGAIDDLTIYNRALSSSEIRALYNGGLRVCRISFAANDGTERKEEEKVLAGAKLKLPASLFCREDYVFQGWATSAGGEVAYADGAEVTVTGDMTLYAAWKRENYKIRLYGNEVATEDGAETVDIVCKFGETTRLPRNPFAKFGMQSGSVSSRFLGWRVGTAAFDWTKERLRDLLLDEAPVSLADEKDLLHWSAVDEAGIPVVRLYAIWKPLVSVDLRGDDGYPLSPASLADCVKFKIGYDGKWRSGGETLEVPPGTHRLTVGADPGFEDYAANWSVWRGNIQRGDGGGSAYEFEISSGEGPIRVRLEVRVSSVSATGTVRLRCTSRMTEAQAAGLKNFPAFDECKAIISVRRQLTQSTGELAIEWPATVRLPEGTYKADFGYADRYWRVFPNPDVVFTVEAGKETIVEGVYLPYGSDQYYSGWLEESGTLRTVDAGGAASVVVPAGVATIAAGAFADGGSLASVSFAGDAPALEAGSLDGLAAGAVVRVARGTTGWGEVPGTWQGRTLAYDSLAELSDDASAGEVSAALAEAAPADGVRLASAVNGDAARYASFREWARSVPGGETAALDSSHAAASWRLGTAAPLANEPVIVLGLPADADAVGGATVLSVAVLDGETPVEADPARVASLLETSSSLLDWSEESRLSPDVGDAPSGGEGEIRFSIVPGEGTIPAAFFRLRME